MYLFLVIGNDSSVRVTIYNGSTITYNREFVKVEENFLYIGLISTILSKKHRSSTLLSFLIFFYCLFVFTKTKEQPTGVL